MGDRSTMSNPLMDDTFRLKWNQRSDEFNLSDEFRSFRSDKSFLDVSIAAFTNTGETKSIRAHQVIVSAYSSVFMQMLLQNPSKSDPIIYLKDVTFEELTKSLDFMYQGEVNLLQSQLDSFLMVANTLQIKGLQGNNSNNTKKAYVNVRELSRERKYQSKRLFDETFNRSQFQKRSFSHELSKTHSQNIKSELLQLAEIQNSAESVPNDLGEESHKDTQLLIDNEDRDEMRSKHKLDKDSKKMRRRNRDMKLE